MIKVLPLILFVYVAFMMTACAQNTGSAQTNQPKTTPTLEVQTKTSKAPAGIENAAYEPNPDENILLLTLSDNNQISYQGKLLDDAALKTALSQYSEKHKNDPTTTGSKLPPYLVENAKSIYIDADANTPFSQILKVLKAVQESSPTSYRAKFIVQPTEDAAGKTAKTQNGRSVISIDLGVPDQPGSLPKPNPLFLTLNVDGSGKITINGDPVERSQLKDTLSRIFKEREDNGVVIAGSTEVDKRVTLFAAPEMKYGDVIKLIDELNETLAKVELGNLRNIPTGPPEVNLKIGNE